MKSTQTFIASFCLVLGATAQISDHCVAIMCLWVSDKLDSDFEAGLMQVTEAQSSLVIWEDLDLIISKVAHRVLRTASLSYEIHLSWLAKASQEMTCGCVLAGFFLSFLCKVVEKMAVLLFQRTLDVGLWI